MHINALDRAGIMFVTELIRDKLTSPDTTQKCHSARNGRNHYINIFGNWKNATMQQRLFGSVTALSEPYYVAVHFL